MPASAILPYCDCTLLLMVAFHALHLKPSWAIWPHLVSDRVLVHDEVFLAGCLVDGFAAFAVTVMLRLSIMLLGLSSSCEWNVCLQGRRGKQRAAA